MPQMRRNSTGQVEGDHLEGITERTEYEEEQQCYSTLPYYDPGEQEDMESQVMDKLCLIKQTE